MIPQPINLPMSIPHAESTSAELRRVKAELGSALSRLNRQHQAFVALLAERDDLTTRLQRELARSARPWVVARDGGRECVTCDQEIRRGEAYEFNAADPDALKHIHCPDPTEGA